MKNARRSSTREKKHEERVLLVAWKLFRRRFPTEKDCVEYIVNLVCSNDIACPECFGHDVMREAGCRLVECQDCNTTSSLLAKSFFAYIKKAYTWVGMIWLLEHGVSVNAFQFHKVAKISYSTANRMFVKINMAIAEKMSVGMEVMSSNFLSLFCKRSRETPARGHPTEEEAARREFEEGQNEQQTTARKQAGMSDLEKTVFAHIAVEPTELNGLLAATKLPVSSLSAALSLLEISGHIEARPGNFFTRANSCGLKNGTPKQPASPFKLRQAVREIIKSTANLHHGISRKYLQNYLAAFWQRTDESRRRRAAVMGDCIDYGIKNGPMTYDKVIRYVTPLRTWVCPRAA